jgi:glutathione S-transferase
MKLYNNKRGNLFSDIAAIAADFAKVQYEEVFVNEEEQKGKEYKAKVLHGKFPALETPEGVIFESAAIARYFGRITKDVKLVGTNDHEAA